MQTRITRQAPGPRGFTLLELVVVVVIMMILLGVAIPAIRPLMQNNSQKQAVNQLTAYLASARAAAVSTKRFVAVVFFEETAPNASPMNANQTAVQMAIADADQSNSASGKYPSMIAGMTVFLPYSGREYLPAGIRLATLSDTSSQALSTVETSGIKTRAIVFDANGQMVLRNGLAVKTSGGVAGSITQVTGDWNFAVWSSSQLSDGVSSPGFVVYDASLYAAQNFASDSARTTWLQKNADVVIVNAYTGNVIR